MPVPFRAERYLNRVDAELAAIPTRMGRCGFLVGQQEAWDSLTRTFIETEGESGPAGAHIDDYRAVVDGLGLRLVRERDARP